MHAALLASMLAFAPCTGMAAGAPGPGAGVSTQSTDSGAAAPQTYAQSISAYKDYMLQCAGCHRFDGSGAAQRGVPSFRDSVGLLASIPAGRDYMIRVPGAAQSQLNNADLAEVLNWAVTTFGPGKAAGNFKPFTASEVGAARPYRFDDVAAQRRKLAGRLAQQGKSLAPYLYGVNRGQ